MRRVSVSKRREATYLVRLCVEFRWNSLPLHKFLARLKGAWYDRTKDQDELEW